MKSQFCPACDKEYQADTKVEALAMVKAHVLRNLEDLTHNAIAEMEEWV